VTNAEGDVMRYRYDTRGRVVTELQPLSVYTIDSGVNQSSRFKTVYAYDAQGRKTSEQAVPPRQNSCRLV
jgi:hypothetical protein